MSTPDSDGPAAPAPALPVGDRQLERIQPDRTLTVRLRPVGDPAGGSGSAEPPSARVLDLSLHGLLVTSVPSLAQDTLVDILDLEPQPIRARVVRQSNLGTHVTFIDHLHPRYTKSRPPGSPGVARSLWELIARLFGRRP
jgi:hypothetical protein